MHESIRIEGDERAAELEQPPVVSDEEPTETVAVDFYFWGIFDPE